MTLPGCDALGRNNAGLSKRWLDHNALALACTWLRLRCDTLSPGRPGSPMRWMGHDAWAFAFHAPPAVAGLLAPQLLSHWASGLPSKCGGTEQENVLVPRDGAAGVALGAAAAAAAAAAAGLRSGFVFAMWAAAALAALLVPAKARPGFPVNLQPRNQGTCQVTPGLPVKPQPSQLRRLKKSNL